MPQASIRSFVARPPRIVGNQQNTWQPRCSAPTRRPLERIVALSEINRAYTCASEMSRDGEDFVESALTSLGITVRLPSSDLARIPLTGPLVVVANHPFGGADGLALLALLRRVRPDVKLLANHFLGVVPELRDSLILVDPFGSPVPHRAMPPPSRPPFVTCNQAECWPFPPARCPASTPASGPSPTRPGTTCRGRLRTNPRRGPPRLLPRPQQPPVQRGRPDPPAAAHATAPPRAARPPPPAGGRHGRQPYPPACLGRFDNADDLTAYLRVRTYLLKGRARTAASPRRAAVVPSHQPLIDPVPPLCSPRRSPRSPPRPPSPPAAPSRSTSPRRRNSARSPRDRPPARAHLPRRRRRHRPTARPRPLRRPLPPPVRLPRRETRNRRRLPPRPGDEILARFGPAGLYTNTLFRYRGHLLDQLCQRPGAGPQLRPRRVPAQFTPLLLLWKGIGRFVADRPQYRRLFGPVSISNDYTSLTKRLLVAFLRMNRSLPNLGRLVEPATPPASPAPTPGPTRSPRRRPATWTRWTNWSRRSSRTARRCPSCSANTSSSTPGS